MTQQVSIKALWDAYGLERSDANRNALVERYLKWVRHEANTLYAALPNSVDVDDLVSDGTLGLIASIPRFDRSRKTKFTNWAYCRVRGAMLDGMRDMDWVPRSVRRKATRLAAVTRKFEIKYGRPPLDWELARAIHLSKQALADLQRDVAPVHVGSLHAHWRNLGRHGDQGDVVEPVEALVDTRNQSPSRPIDRREWLRDMLRGLNQHERLIVISYFYEAATMRAIGTSLAMSESRVSQMLTAIKTRLKALRSHGDFNDTGNWRAMPVQGTIRCQPLPSAPSHYRLRRRNQSRSKTDSSPSREP